MAQGRFLQTVELYKPEGQSLGFKVVGLDNENKHFQGIYIQEIHDNGIAARYVFTFALFDIYLTMYWQPIVTLLPHLSLTLTEIEIPMQPY